MEMYGSMAVTAEALQAAAAWATAGPDMAPVHLDVRVGDLTVWQGDDVAEFHADGTSDDPDVRDARPLTKLLRRCKDLEQSNGSWPGGDIVEMLFTEHGYDINAPVEAQP
jgi:hypothetical protein